MCIKHKRNWHIWNREAEGTRMDGTREHHSLNLPKTLTYCNKKRCEWGIAGHFRTPWASHQIVDKHCNHRTFFLLRIKVLDQSFPSESKRNIWEWKIIQTSVARTVIFATAILSEKHGKTAFNVQYSYVCISFYCDGHSKSINYHWPSHFNFKWCAKESLVVFN